MAKDTDKEYMEATQDVNTDIKDIVGKRELYKEGVKSMEKSGKKVPSGMKSYHPAPYMNVRGRYKYIGQKRAK